MRIGLLGVVILAALAATNPANAQGRGPRVERFDRTNIRFDAMLGVGWYQSVGPGFRVEFPLIRNLTRGMQNELYVSAGGELRWFFHHKYDGFGAYPVGTAQWDFHVSRDWVVFPELGMVGIFAPHRDRFWRAPIAPFVGGGARYYFGERTAVVFRLNWPVGAQVGITF